MSRSERRRSGRSGSSEGVTGSVIGLILMAIVVGILATVFIYYQKNNVDVDKEGCPLDSSLMKQKWVVMIDTTSPFIDNQPQALKNLAKQLTAAAPKYTRINVYQLTDNILTNQDKLATVCSPGDPAEVDKWVQNQKIAQANFEENFKNKIDEVIKTVSSTKGASASPIMESLQAIALIEFGDVSWNGKNKLILVSDLIQFSDSSNLDLYKPLPDYQKLKQSGSLNRLYAPLKGVEVNAMILQNNPSLQNGNFVDFWKSYFKDSKAGVSTCIFAANCSL
jgi:hypothetical protein